MKEKFLGCAIPIPGFLYSSLNVLNIRVLGGGSRKFNKGWPGYNYFAENFFKIVGNITEKGGEGAAAVPRPHPINPPILFKE